MTRRRFVHSLTRASLSRLPCPCSVHTSTWNPNQSVVHPHVYRVHVAASCSGAAWAPYKAANRCPSTAPDSRLLPLTLVAFRLPTQAGLVLAYYGLLAPWGRDEAITTFIVFAAHRFTVCARHM